MSEGITYLRPEENDTKIPQNIDKNIECLPTLYIRRKKTIFAIIGVKNLEIFTKRFNKFIKSSKNLRKIFGQR